MMISRFKIQIKTNGGEARWADAGKVFAHLLDEHNKKEDKLKELFKNREAKFIKQGDEDWPPSDVPGDKEHECDLDLGNKLNDWKEIFASRLIQIAVKLLGKVKDCEVVKAASNDYRNSQDYLMRFFNEKITGGLETDKISKSNVLIEFKEWWKQENPGERIPQAQELIEFLTIKCGVYHRRGWRGWKIVYDMYDDDE